MESTLANFTFDHVHLKSRDSLAAARYYVDTLGAKETTRLERGGGYRVVLSLHGLNLLIDSVEADASGAPTPPFSGIEHFALTTNDLDTALADIRGKGGLVIVDPYSPRPGIRIAFLEGPDSVRIELLEKS